MTELDILKRAKMYIDAMAAGVDPLSNQPVPENDTLNQVRISRCLFYVSDVLGKVINHGGTDFRQSAVRDYTITPEQAANILVTDEPVGISEFSKRIAAVLPEGAAAPAAIVLTAWLEQHGFLTAAGAGGRKGRMPTQMGIELGIFTVEGVSMEGRPYQKNMYPRSAQQWMKDHLADLQRERAAKQ